MWLVMNIGCLHCEAQSSIVGLYTLEAEADAVAARLNETRQMLDDGQHAYFVFKMPEPRTI